MTDLMALLALIGVALGLLWLAGLRGALWTMAVAALLFGGAGYVFQGRPGLAGSPGTDRAPQAPLPLANARHAFLGRFNQADRWLIIADGYASRGKTQDAVGIIQSGIRAHPDDYGLWVGLGNALTDHARMLTPAANLAYDRAAQLAPWSPAPGFFRGLAMLRSGDADGALAQWKAILAQAPAQAGWRPMVEDGVAMIEGQRR